MKTKKITLCRRRRNCAYALNSKDVLCGVDDRPRSELSIPDQQKTCFFYQKSDDEDGWCKFSFDEKGEITDGCMSKDATKHFTDKELKNYLRSRKYQKPAWT